MRHQPKPDLHDTFMRLVQLDPDAQSRELQRLVHEDPRLHDRLERMLAVEDSDLDLNGSRPHHPVTRDVLPRPLGRFSLQVRLGAGSAGEVYRAVDQDSGETVALKLLHPEHETTDRLRRFEREADVLRALDHPHIAAWRGAGTIDTGRGLRRYLAMEYVDGEPIDRYVARHRLGVDAIVGMMIEVADGVHFAHMHTVIHRDLKPGNVLVDRGGHPRIVDFGLARFGAAGSISRTGGLVGTIEYMSPEQAAGAMDRTDLRSDVYALGALTYRLLAGVTPLEVEGLSLPEACRRIAFDPPPALRDRRPDVSRDLSTVISACLRKDPSRRYQTAADFAADLRRCLAERPIAIRDLTLRYMLGRWIARHRAILAVVAVALTGALVALGWGVHQSVARMADRADARSSRTVLNVVFDSTRAHESGLLAVDLLESVSEAMDDPNSDVTPADRLEFRLRAAVSISMMEADERAFAMVEKARAAALRDWGPDHVELKECDLIGVIVALNAGRGARALSLLEGIGSADGLTPEDTRTYRQLLAVALAETGRRTESIAVYEALIRDCETAGAVEDGLVASAQLAVVLNLEKDTDRAREIIERVLPALDSLIPADDPRLLDARQFYAQVLRTRGACAEALRILDEVIAVRTQQQGATHDRTLEAHMRRGETLRSLRRFEEALDVFQWVLRIREDRYPRTQKAVLFALSRIAHIFGEMKRPREALATASDLRQRCDEELRADSSFEFLPGFWVNATCWSIRAHLELGDTESARREADEMRERAKSPVFASRRTRIAEFLTETAIDAEHLNSN